MFEKPYECCRRCSLNPCSEIQRMNCWERSREFQDRWDDAVKESYAYEREMKEYEDWEGM